MSQNVVLGMIYANLRFLVLGRGITFNLFQTLVVLYECATLLWVVGRWNMTWLELLAAKLAKCNEK